VPDNLTPEDRRKTMRAVKGEGTRLERRLFSMLAGMRVRGWRIHPKEPLGKPDVAFPTERVVIFVDGCFWHGCPYCKRKLPQTNREYWERKIGRNIERDNRNTEALQRDGWRVVRIWEHELRTPIARDEVHGRLRAALQRQCLRAES
jgi:DNA mismatch endonuclease Vsr